ncbi:NAD(P)/FAD-dependent oxidoreductase [Comamonas composti]|uniref:NAD(P)/FAD-dependent oxidoreductase n=1 Tax=Comamonas composti TaxID=408558 RepID=UPI000425A9F2|nr:FAD-dependent oxidoreductase [Comamonas composti]
MTVSRAPQKSKASPGKARKPAGKTATAPQTRRQRIAVVGAGLAGIACARTLMQAGHEVEVYERLTQAGGRMRSVSGPHGSFDLGAQYFTVRDPRFELALQTTPEICRPWSASALRTVDAQGRQTGTGTSETHWVAAPYMQALPLTWADPLWDAGRLHLGQRVTQVVHLPEGGWRLHTQAEGRTAQTTAAFDAVVLALPAPLARQLLQTAPQALPLIQAMTDVEMAPCWAMTLSYPMAGQAGLSTLGPQWNAARSSHARASWVVRESSKPGRNQSERWTVHASPEWSQEHALDDAERVLAKMQKAFGEVTRIRVAPHHASVHLWPHAQTLSPLGQSHLWNASLKLGLCGDWCLGRRVEDAFVSGLEMAMVFCAP